MNIQTWLYSIRNNLMVLMFFLRTIVHILVLVHGLLAVSSGVNCLKFRFSFLPIYLHFTTLYKKLKVIMN